MANYTIDPVTGIKIPTVGVDPGTDYAVNISEALEVLAHLRHTGASNEDGYQIPAAGLDIDDDISIQENNVTDVKSVRLTDQTVVLAGSGDVDCIYTVEGNLYYNNGDGVPVEITNGDVVNVTASNNFSLTEKDANFTIDQSDPYSVYDVSPSAAILATLPLAADVPAGRFYFFKDKTGTCNTYNITIQTAGSDLIDGVSSTEMKNNYGVRLFISDGVSQWTEYKFAQNTYNAGESLTFNTGSSLLVQSGATLTVDGGATTSITNGVLVTPAITGGSLGATVISTLNEQIVEVGTGAYNVTTAVIILCNGSGGITINLPASQSGRIITIKDKGGAASTNNITIATPGSETIEGLTADYIMDADFQGVTLAADSTSNWWIIGTA